MNCPSVETLRLVDSLCVQYPELDKFFANGAQKLREQREEIDRLNAVLASMRVALDTKSLELRAIINVIDRAINTELSACQTTSS